MPSSFAWALRSLPWLPSSNGTALKGGDLFLRSSREVMQVLHDHVPYLDASIKNTSMLSCLGIQDSVTVPLVLRLLQSWSQSQAFATSLQHMTHVYEYLSWQMASDPTAAVEICAAFSANSFVWLPAKLITHSTQEADALLSVDSHLVLEPPKRSQVIPGQFYTARDKLFMRDHTHIIEETAASPMRVLLKYYHSDELHTFFLHQLVTTQAAAAPALAPGNFTTFGFTSSAWGQQTAAFGQPSPLVSLYPSTEDYMQLLNELAALPEPDDHTFGQAIAVLLHWSKLMGSGQMPRQDVQYIQQALYKQAVLPSEKGKWVSLADGVVIRDDEEVGKAFENQPVHFLWLLPSSEPTANRCGSLVLP